MLWIRKVHSACGLIFAAFLLEHLMATALGLNPSLFGRYMHFLYAVVAFAPLLRALIFVPLVVAVAFGGYLLVTSGIRYDVKKCNRGGKLRYWLQRVSGMLILLFLGFHLGTIRNFPVDRIERAPTTASSVTGASAQTTFGASVEGFQASWPKKGVLYPLRVLAVLSLFVGTWAAVYHLSNGLWSAAMAWGFLNSPEAQQRWQWVCAAIGIVLAILGTMGGMAFSSIGGMPIAGV